MCENDSKIIYVIKCEIKLGIKEQIFYYVMTFWPVD